jgi:hypothetical protein
MLRFNAEQLWHNLISQGWKQVQSASDHLVVLLALLTSSLAGLRAPALLRKFCTTAAY